MKIKKIEFKNLNSLYGEYKIDFEDKAFKNNSTFIISGPTGSGKTTILDAITLALYSRTPRQGVITKNTNNLMSIGTGSCYSSVEFEVDNKNYKAIFSQKRAKNKADGNLQDPVHNLIYLDEDNKTTNKRQDTINAIENEVLKLKYEAFLQSIMLSQGEFDKFLSAKDKDKAQILATLTFTDEYAKISTKVFSLTKEKENEINNLNIRLDDITLLNEDEIKEKENLIKEITKECKNLNDQIQYLQIKETIKELKEEKENLKNNILDDKNKLEKEKQTEKDLFKERKEKDIIFKKVKTLDTALNKKTNEILNLKDKIDALNNRIKNLEYNEKENKEKLEKEKEIQIEIKKQKEKLFYDKNFEQISKYQVLITSYLDIKESKTDLIFIDKEINSNKDIFLKITNEINQIENIIKEKEEVKKNISISKDKILIDKIKTLLKQEEKLLTQKKQLKDYILSLEDGKPCPVCHSLKHFNNDFNEDLEIIENDIKDLNNQINYYEKLNNKIRDLENSINEDQRKEFNLKEEKTKVENKIETSSFKLKEITEKLNEKEKIEKELKPLFKTLNIDFNNDCFINLEKYKNECEKVKESETRNTNQINILQELIKKYKNDLDNERKEFKTIEKDLKEKEKDYSENKEQRFALFSDKDLETEERLLLKKENDNKTCIKVLEEKIKNNQEFLNKTSTKLKENEDKIKELNCVIKEENIYLLSNKKDNLISEKASLLKELELNKESKKTNEKLLKEKEEKTIELNLWQELNDLIGSSSGDKFQKKVQSLTFSILLNKANTELSKISDRYRLISQGDSLDLFIIDSYQQNDIRSASNLSGGETFLVSLALALGLSKMASDNLVINSLFLDEGFGTLDSEVLETVVNCLSSLSDDNKLIGLISHREELKENIRLKINLEPLGNGKSKLSGCGVSKIG